MSNHKSDEKSDHRKPKVSLAMDISQGLGGPKAIPKGAVDGQGVNIRPLPHFSKERRSLVVWARYWIRVVGLRISVRQIRQSKFKS